MIMLSPYVKQADLPSHLKAKVRLPLGYLSGKPSGSPLFLPLPALSRCQCLTGIIVRAILELNEADDVRQRSQRKPALDRQNCVVYNGISPSGGMLMLAEERRDILTLRLFS